MQALKTHDIDLLRHNGAAFTEFELVPQPDSQVFAVEFKVVTGENEKKENAVLMNARGRIRTFGNIYKAVVALRKIFPELDDEEFIKYRLP